MRTTRRLLLTLALLTAAALPLAAHGQITQRWLTQWGTSAADATNGVAVDAAGKTWATGNTAGSLGGSRAGGLDLFLTPLSTTGVLGTSVQRGGTADEVGNAAAVVGGSTVFSVGYTTTTTAWDGAAAVGSLDTVAVSYSTAGAYQSTTRWGSTADDGAFAAAGNATRLLTAGGTLGMIDGQATMGDQDAYLSLRTNTGALVWTRVVGTSAFDTGGAAALDTAGNAYLAGNTTGSLPTFTNAGTGGTNDLFLARYNATGTQTLLRQWGSSGSDTAGDMEVDGSGNIYLTGSTSGTSLGGQTSHGGNDAFLIKLDSGGNVLWTRLLGGTSDDLSFGLALDAAGRVWIGGYSSSNFAGHTNAGGPDAFVALFDALGTLLDTRFWGGAGDDEITGLAAAPDGSVSASGYTSGTLGTGNAGDYDNFALSVYAIPEPGSPALFAAALVAAAALRRRRQAATAISRAT